MGALQSVNAYSSHGTEAGGAALALVQGLGDVFHHQNADSRRFRPPPPPAPNTHAHYVKEIKKPEPTVDSRQTGHLSKQLVRPQQKTVSLRLGAFRKKIDTQKDTHTHTHPGRSQTNTVRNMPLRFPTDDLVSRVDRTVEQPFVAHSWSHSAVFPVKLSAHQPDASQKWVSSGGGSRGARTNNSLGDAFIGQDNAFTRA